MFTLTSQNGIPLKTVAKVLVLDSLFNPLLPISLILGKLQDSSVTFNAGNVDADGFSTTSTTTSYSAVLDSVDISKIKRMGKIIYENKLFTDPNHIPDPLNSVKIRSGDRISMAGFGTPHTELILTNIKLIKMKKLISTAAIFFFIIGSVNSQVLYDVRGLSMGITSVANS
ncbi:MAG: hypothetical protein IPM38_00040 [Ignavibacteria bacterium]|nr:hypothetical protein [Ignavibacteria bacterium]